MSTRFSFGDLVVCSNPALAGSMTPGAAAVGVLAELRKTDCRVQYLRMGRSVWMPLRDLRAARQEEVDGTLEELIAGLLSLLGASEMEFMSLDTGNCRLLASHGTTLPETVDEVRAKLGTRLVTYLIRPQGMHRTQTVLEISVADPISS